MPEEYLYRDDLLNYQEDSVPRQESSLLLDMATGMLKFGLGMMVLRKGSAKLTRSVMNRLVSSGKGTVAGEIARKSGAGVGGMGVNQIIQRMNLGSLFRGVSRLNPRTLSSAGVGPKWIKGVSMAGTITKHVGRTARYARSRLQSSGVIGAKRMARAGTYVAKHIPAYAAFYGLERTFGVFEGTQVERPPLWNIPGVAADFTKFVGEMAVFDGVMHGAKIAFKGLRKAVAGFAETHLSTKSAPGLHQFMDKKMAAIRRIGTKPDKTMGMALSFASKLSAAKAFVGSVGSDVNKKFRESFGREAVRRQYQKPDNKIISRPFWKQTLDAARAAASTAETNLINKHKAFSNNPDMMLTFLTGLVERAGGLKPDTILMTP